MNATIRPRDYDPLVSLIVPVFNEEDVLDSFLKKTSSVMQETDLDYEYIFVNDGSTDATPSSMPMLPRLHPPTEPWEPMAMHKPLRGIGLQELHRLLRKLYLPLVLKSSMAGCTVICVGAVICVGGASSLYP